LLFLDVERVTHSPNFPGRHEIECLALLCELYSECRNKKQWLAKLKEVVEIAKSLEILFSA